VGQDETGKVPYRIREVMDRVWVRYTQT